MRRSTFIAVVFAFAVAGRAVSAPIGEGPNTIGLLGQGFGLSHNDSVMLEARLQEYDFDLAARIPLLAYYQQKIAANPYDDELRRDQRRHVLWLVRNNPRLDIVATSWCLIDPKYDHLGYTRGKEAWIEHTRKHPQDAVILLNAARFITPTEPVYAERLLKKAMVAEPSNTRVRLAMAAALVKQAQPVKAIEELEAAIGFATSEQRQSVIADAADIAFEAGKLAKAKEYADKSLEMVMSSRDPQRGVAMHRAHTVLGRLALAGGSSVIARFHLLEAGNSPLPKSVAAFGPSMVLARELLARGERDTVLKYLDLCSVWWQPTDDRLIRWKAEIESGGVPHLSAVNDRD